MSGKANPKGVVNTFRRTWDKEEYREKAEEREKEVRIAGLDAVLQCSPPTMQCAVLVSAAALQLFAHCLVEQEAKVEDDALALKKRKRLERDPLHQVRGDAATVHEAVMRD